LATAQAPLIFLDGISKRFGSLWANRDISLTIFEGEIHAVVGENGAGKSTLMKMLYGHLQPDGGKILLHGQPVVFRHPREAMRAGIGMVHQQLLIFPQLSALENVITGAEDARWGWIDRKKVREKLLRLCRLFEFDLPLDAPAGELPFAHRQQIELLRVLYRDAKILILDEPTSLLALPEISQLLELLKSLREGGHTIVFISHRLREVFAVADSISILRRGQCTGTGKASATTMEEVAKAIVFGEKMSDVDADESGEMKVEVKGGIETRWSPESAVLGAGDQPVAPPLLRMEAVSAPPSEHEVGIEGFSLQIRQGEILGIGGVVGNGQRALARALAGIMPVEQGHILFGGTRITHFSVQQRVRMGIHLLPANATEEMLLPSLSIWQNMLLGRHRDTMFQYGGWLRKRRIIRWVEEQLQVNEVKYGNVADALHTLSGGNQQKVALARAMAGSPGLVILEQPARGLDIGAQERLRGKVRSLNAHGVTFVLLSYDLDELLSLSHRIGVLYRGRLMGLVERNEAYPEQLGRWMLGLKE